MSRVAVFLKHQNPIHDKPVHRASSVLVQQLLRYNSPRLAKAISSTAIQLLTTQSWSDLKGMFRAAAGTGIDKLLPPLEHYPCFVMSYPPVAHDEAELLRQERIWMRDYEPWPEQGIEL